MHEMAQSANALLNEGFAKIAVPEKFNEKVQDVIRGLELFQQELAEFKQELADLENTGDGTGVGYFKYPDHEIFQYHSIVWRKLSERGISLERCSSWLRDCDHILKDAVSIVEKCCEALDREVLRGYNFVGKTHAGWDAAVPHRHMLRIAWYPPSDSDESCGRAWYDNSFLTLCVTEQTSGFYRVRPGESWKWQEKLLDEILLLPGEKAPTCTNGAILPLTYRTEFRRKARWEISCLVQVPPT